MFESNCLSKNSKSESYISLCEQLRNLLSDECDWIANMSNTAALIFHGLPHLNWVGFYLLNGDELVLGPFQGKVACARLAVGRGACGTAAERRETLIIADVAAFPDHITCDRASRSEIVIPLIFDGNLVGVLDIDSPLLSHFNRDDAEGLSGVVQVLITSSEVRAVATKR